MAREEERLRELEEEVNNPRLVQKDAGKTLRRDLDVYASLHALTAGPIDSCFPPGVAVAAGAAPGDVCSSTPEGKMIFTPSSSAGPLVDSRSGGPEEALSSTSSHSLVQPAWSSRPAGWKKTEEENFVVPGAAFREVIPGNSGKTSLAAAQSFYRRANGQPIVVPGNQNAEWYIRL